MNRGSVRGGGESGSDANRFNEAPIHESGKFCECGRLHQGQIWASMRPRFMNRGSSSGQDPKALGRYASMRPRFMNRGSDPDHGPVGWVRRASMRPRFMNRGSLRVSLDRSASIAALQ